MNLVKQQYLELLRSGLWGTPADTELFKGKVRWNKILYMAHQQATDLIVIDGIETLPAELWPPIEVTYKIAVARTGNTLMHKLLNSTIKQITEALNAEGIPSILLKGQGVAQNYRRPMSRMCGDIDLYIGHENLEKACEVMEKIGAVKAEYENDLHKSFQIEDAYIELHKTPTTTNIRKQDRILNEWIRESLDADSALKQTWNNDGTEVCLPPHTFNAFFLLHHAVRHLVSDGIGLRQISDWTLYLDAYKDEINVEELQKKLKEFKMEAVWNEFSILAVEYLKLDENKLPIKPKKTSSRKTEILLDHIFITGNFGQHAEKKIDIKETNIIKRKWRNFRIVSSRLSKLYKVFPCFILSYCRGWLKSGLYRLITLKS